MRDGKNKRKKKRLFYVAMTPETFVYISFLERLWNSKSQISLLIQFQKSLDED